MNNFIRYVICKKVEAAETEEIKNHEKKSSNPSQFEEKAFAFHELIAAKGKLVPDVDWYIM